MSPKSDRSICCRFMIVHYNVDYVDYQDYNFLDAMLPSPSTLARYTSNLVLWMDSTTSWFVGNYLVADECRTHLVLRRDVMEAPSQTCFIDNSFSPPLLDISAINRKPKLFTVKMEEAAHEISQLRSNPTSPLCWAVTCEVLMYPRSQVTIRSKTLNGMHSSNNRYKYDNLIPVAAKVDCRLSSGYFCAFP